MFFLNFIYLDLHDMLTHHFFLICLQVHITWMRNVNKVTRPLTLKFLQLGGLEAKREIYTFILMYFINAK